MRTPQPWALPGQPATFAMLAAAGVSESMIRSQLRSGRLLRLRHGVYLSTSSWPDDPAEQHVMLARAETVANPDSVISHQSAAVIWGLPTPGFFGWADKPVSISLPAGARHTAHPTHHVAELPPDQLASADGYAVTSLARTAVDLVAGLALPQALVILDAAARKLCEAYVVSPRRSDYASPRLAEAACGELRRVANTRPGPSLTQAIELTNPARESVAESLSAGHFELAGLPRPRCQAKVVTSQGTFYPDFFWAEQNLIGECDGAVKYGRASAYELEKEREQVLRDAGFWMVRWLAKEILTRPDVVVDRVARKLAT